MHALKFRINWEIKTPYAGAAGMLLHRMKTSGLGSEIISFAVKVCFNRLSLSYSRCESRYETTLTISVVF